MPDRVEVIIAPDINYNVMYFHLDQHFILGIASDVISWYMSHPPSSCVLDGDLSVMVRNSVLEGYQGRDYENHGHYNVMVVSKLKILFEYTRLHAQGLNLEFYNSIPAIVSAALRHAKNWHVEILRLEQQTKGSNWGTSNVHDWCQYLSE